MSEEDVLKYLANQATPPKAVATPSVVRTVRNRKSKPQDTYKDFSASHLFCPKCQQAMPVKEMLLLYLPTGTLYDYRCERCRTSVGTRKTGI